MSTIWLMSTFIPLVFYGVIAISLSFLNEAKVYRLMTLRLPISSLLALLLWSLAVAHYFIIISYLSPILLIVMSIVIAVFIVLIYKVSPHLSLLNKCFPYLSITNSTSFGKKEKEALYAIFRTLIMLSMVLVVVSAYYVFV